jgi:aspartate racemase
MEGEAPMKTIGLLGGMSWESTVPYYQIINREVNERLGGLHSAKLVLYSVDFDEIEKLQHAGKWNETGEILANRAESLEAAGADCLVLCTNTMHKVADQIQAAIDIPLLHIADAVADRVKAAELSTVGLLGTRFTMEEDFYRRRLQDLHGISVVIPNEDDRATIHRVIYDELCLGQVVDSSRGQFSRIIAGLGRAGAECVVLGCTEISMLVGPADVDLSVYDSTEIHARSAVSWALS